MGCGTTEFTPPEPTPPAPTPIVSAANVNLVFVVTPEVGNDPLGDINASTGNLNNQGLQRSLMMGTYLKQQILRTSNVTGIYAVQPMSHLQTMNQLPDMVPYGFVQQFAMLNQKSVEGTTGSSFPINVGVLRRQMAKECSISISWRHVPSMQP